MKISSTTGRMLLALALCTWGPARALEPSDVAKPAPSLGDSSLSLGGFGTLGALYHNNEGIEYRRTLQQPHGVTAGKPSLGSDSLLGIQINARASRHLEVVMQAVSQWRPDNGWAPQINRGFLRLDADDSIVLRLGRVPLDSQSNSDSRLIGYASLAIRAGQALQTTVPVDAIDGGDLRVSFPMAEGVAFAKLFYGATSTRINASGSDVPLSDTLARGLIVGYGGYAWSGRLYGGIATLQTLGGAQALLDAMRAVPIAQVQDAAAVLDQRGARVHFYGADLAYDSGPLTLQGAVIKHHTNPQEVLLPDIHAVAFLAGYRMGSVTPYAQYSRAHQYGPGYAPGLSAFGAGAFDAPIAQAIAMARMYQRSEGLGIRIDVAKNMAVKCQVDRITATHSALVQGPERTEGATRRFTLFGLALDFTF